MVHFYKKGGKMYLLFYTIWDDLYFSQVTLSPRS